MPRPQGTGCGHDWIQTCIPGSSPGGPSKSHSAVCAMAWGTPQLTAPEEFAGGNPRSPSREHQPPSSGTSGLRTSAPSLTQEAPASSRSGVNIATAVAIAGETIPPRIAIPRPQQRAANRAEPGLPDAQ